MLERLTAAEQWIVRQVDVLLGAEPSASVAIPLGHKQTALVPALETGHTSASFTVVDIAAASPTMHARLTAAGRFHMIAVTAEVGAEITDLASLYGSVLFHVVPGGRLLTADFHPRRGAPGGLWPLLCRQDRRAESAPLPGLGVDPAVVHPRLAHRQRTRRGRHLPYFPDQRSNGGLIRTSCYSIIPGKVRPLHAIPPETIHRL